MVIVDGVMIVVIIIKNTGAGAATVPAVSRVKAEPAAVDLSNPTKALCKLKSYKIGYDVFSDSQPFAVSLSDGLKSAAASVGCRADRPDG